MSALHELAQERFERFHRQVAGMCGSFWYATHLANQLFPAHLLRFFDGLAFDQFGEGRPTCHCRHASLGAKTDVRDLPPCQLGRKFQNISTGRIFHLRRGVRSFDVACVARVLKMIQQFRRIHSRDCNAAAFRFRPYR